MHPEPDQRPTNPDVNSFEIDHDPSENQTDQTNDPKDVERIGNSDIESIPLPPDVPTPSPVEEPVRDDTPIGDVDDSPKRIAG